MTKKTKSVSVHLSNKKIKTNLINSNICSWYSLIQHLYSHIASSIIPTVSLVAVPSVASQIPQQKTRANEQWGPLASTLIRASSVDQLLIPSTTHLHSQPNIVHRRSIGRMDASTDENSR